MVHATSPSEKRRQRRRAARHEALLDAAWAVLVHEGPDALTMARVARQADVAVGGLYRYFDTKDVLVAELQVRAVQAFGRFLGARLDGVDAPLDRIRTAAAAWGAFAEAEPERFALLDASLSDPAPNLPDEAARAVDEALRPVLGTVARAFEAAVEAGTLSPGDATLRTHAVWAAVHGAAHLRKRERLGSPRAGEVRDVVVEALLAAWRG